MSCRCTRLERVDEYPYSCHIRVYCSHIDPGACRCLVIRGLDPEHVSLQPNKAAGIDLVHSEAAPWSTLPVPGASETLQQADVVAGFGKLPLYFVENQGQLDQRVAYYIRGDDKTIYFTPDGVTFALMANGTPTLSPQDEPNFRLPANEEAGQTANRRWAVKLDFVGANPNVSPIGQGKTEAVVSYFKGSREQWQAGLPTYSRLIYPNLWPGIDLVYYGTVGQLKYEFIVKPGADPAQIRLAYRGASDVALNAAGQLEVTTPIGGFHDDTPVAYQDIDGQRVAVRMAFAVGDCEAQSMGCEYVTGDPQSANHTPHSYGFSIGSYDLTHPLILDPAVLVYCGYIGGNADDWGGDIAVDDAGNVYVTGGTDSTEASFPIMGGPDLSYNDLGGPFQGDVFVAKVNAAGTDLVYVGYIGGNDEECGTSIAVDRSGEAYVTGWTRTTEATFPVTVGPDLSYNSSDFNGDAFVAKVNAAGTDLIYAGYIGGVSGDAGYGIAVDAEGTPTSQAIPYPPKTPSPSRLGQTSPTTVSAWPPMRSWPRSTRQAPAWSTPAISAGMTTIEAMISPWTTRETPTSRATRHLLKPAFPLPSGRT